jgi:hypothetical protein
MTRQERKDEFDRLFLGLPGTNPERIRAVCAALFVRENTVRGWRLKQPHRVISERSLAMLRRAIG